jgi:hypothetical protein
VLTLKARRFSKIKGQIQYNQRKTTAKPKGNDSKTEGKHQQMETRLFKYPENKKTPLFVNET